MKEKNDGFTLVELLVSIAIIGILTLAAYSFMVSGSNIYESVGTRLELRMDAQLAANQLEAYIIDCNENIYFDGESLFIINRMDNAYTAHIFQMKGGSINYDVTSAVKNPDESYSCEYSANDLLCENVSDFSVEISVDGDGRAAYAELKLKLERREREFYVKKSVALRNRVTANFAN